jgi:DNA-binding beta-propeller fold protein YncE
MSYQNRLRRSSGARVLVGGLLMMVVGLALSGTARAAESANHPFVKTLITGVKGQVPAPVIEAPCGLATDPEGGFYVSDYYRRQIFTSPKTIEEGPPPFYFTGLPALPAENGPCELAADGSNLYVNYWHDGVVNTVSGVIDPGPVTGMAVNPITNDLYVNHRTSIAVYAAPVDPGDAPAFEIDPGPGGALLDGYGMAVRATTGWIYVADAGDNTVKAYDPASPTPNIPVQVIDGAGTASGRFVSLTDASLAVDQASGDLFVVDNVQPGFEHPLAAIVEFNDEGLYRGQLEHQITHGEPVGIVIDETSPSTKGWIYVTSGNGLSSVVSGPEAPPAAELGAVLAFGPAGSGQSLEVTRSGSGQGSLKSSPAGIACPGSCKAEFNSGRLVTLTATPSAGSVFAGWSGACTGTGKCEVILNSATVVNAEFVPAPPPLSIGSAGKPDAVTADAEAAVGNTSGLELGRATAQGATVALRAIAPGAGTLTASGKGLKPLEADLDRSGPVTLHLRLDRAGKRALARSKRGRLALRVALVFRPSHGAAGSVVGKNVTFKQTKGNR